MDSIKILQHNVLSWGNRKFNLIETYASIDPDIILINSHGLKENENIKIRGFNSYNKNMLNENHDGIAILVKNNIKHKIIDDFITNILETEIETSLGKISIATTYLPPRRPYLPIPDFHKLASNNHPTYIIGDLNAHHTLIGSRRNNIVGKGLEIFLQRGKLLHLGP